MACADPHILTNAAAAVLADLEGMALQWQLLSSPGGAWQCGSFECVTPDGRLVSLNVLDGCLLLDGRPPSRLPRSILEHPLYQRTFGSVNFEVRLWYCTPPVSRTRQSWKRGLMAATRSQLEGSITARGANLKAQ